MFEQPGEIKSIGIAMSSMHLPSYLSCSNKSARGEGVSVWAGQSCSDHLAKSLPVLEEAVLDSDGLTLGLCLPAAVCELGTRQLARVA